MAIAPIHFTAGKVDINLTAPGAPQSVGLALAQNTPFPDDAFQDGAISLGSIKAAASQDFKLDQTAFKAGASAFAGFGVYRDSRKLFAALKAEGLDEPMVTGLIFPTGLDLYALRWGYELSGSISGKIALGPGVSFGASGRTQGLYAVLRSLPPTDGSRDAIAETINSWKMPRQVSKPDDLDPGTWLISETDGEIKLSLGLEYGYNYSWVRESLTLAGLAGDVGLKIEAGIKAQLGFNASGRYAVVLMRKDAGQELRLQIFKLRQHGWTFALDASVSAQVQQNLIPDNFNDFIKGIFNLHGSQVFKDIESWLDPTTSVSQIISSRLVEYLEQMVESITGIKPKDIDDALDKLREPIKRWHALPQEITSVLYDLLRQQIPLADLSKFLQTVIDQADPQKLAEEISDQLRGITFFSTPFGKWLTAAAEEGILSLLANIDKERAQLVDLAKKTLDLLDGKTVEDTLRKLQEWIETRLGLDKILAITDEASFAQLDTWLKQRLTDFLGRTVVFKDLEKIKTAINKLRDKGNDFYVKGYKALMDKYVAEFHYSYQKTTTRTALIDVTFDFSLNAQNATNYLGQALNGDFTRLLTDVSPTAGVKLNKGVLTHEIKRRTHLEVDLPFYKFSLDHINESLATGEVVDTEDGRLWIFNLKAQDTVSKKAMMSKLAIDMEMTRSASIRRFSAEDYKYNYVLRLTKHDARTEFMEHKLEILIDKYLGSEFSGDGKAPFPAYLAELDNALDNLGVTGKDRFGNVLVGFDVSLPSSVFGGWKNVPAKNLDPVYTLMSREVQKLLRQWLPLCYIREPEQYDETVAIYPLLAYCSLPPINRVSLKSGKPQFTEEKVLDWEYQDDQLRNAVLTQLGVPKLRDEILPRIRAELISVSRSTAKYEDSRIGEILSSPRKSTQHWSNFTGLMVTESDIVTGIHHAGLDFRKYLDANNIEAAKKTLAEFGSGLTDTFNNRIGSSNYAGETLRPLGSLLFVEVSKLFDPAPANVIVPVAMLELLVLKDQSTFVMADFLQGKRPPDADLALQQRIVSRPGTIL
jgi:hypothetical protein